MEATDSIPEALTGAAGKTIANANEVEALKDQLNDILTKVDQLEHRVDDVEQFYVNLNKKQTNTSKGSSVAKEKERERAITSVKKQQQDALHREAAAAKRMQDLIRQFGSTLFRQITQHKWAWPFQEPVDAEKLGIDDYYQVIEKPMDFSTIRKKMEAKDGTGYKNVREICTDMRLVFKNAMKYNDETNDVHVMAKTLLEKFEEKWLGLLPKVMEEERRLEEEEAEAKLDMQIMQETTYARVARDISNELFEVDTLLEELMSPEEYVHGSPTKSMREDGSCMKSAFSGDLNYYRNQRDDTGRLRSPGNFQGGYPWNTGNRSPQTPGRQHNAEDNHRYQQEKISFGNGLNPSQKCVGEGPPGSAESKPHKWSRPFSLSSRIAGVNNPCGLKGLGKIDSSETNVESASKAVLPLSEKASADVFSVASSEDATSRKKRRLGWGEGLAKFEKKKVEGPTVSPSERDENTNLSVYPANEENSEVEMVSVCPPPTTPSSDAEKKIHPQQDMNCKSVKSVSDINGSEHSHYLPKSLPVGLSSDLKELDVISMINSSSSMEELLQSVGLDSTNSSSAVSTAMGKLCTWKNEVFKVLEITESEIDSLESELKLLVSDSGGSSVSGVQLAEDDVKHQQEDSAMYSMDKHDGPVAGISLNVNDGIQCHGITSSQFDSSVLKEGTSDVEEQKLVEEIDASQSKGKELSLLPVNCAEDTGSCSTADAKLCQMILASNKESAKEASQVLSNLLQNDHGLEVLQNGTMSCQNNSLRDKFVKRKRFLKFKEKVIAFKFQASHQSWVEDVSKLYLKKSHTKSGKKHEASLRVTQGGRQNKRFSTRSHVPSSGSPRPRSILSIANNLKPYREALKMPALILDEKQKNQCRFISKNGLVEDPKAVEKEKSVINPWTEEEKGVFLEQFVTHGKDFRKISTFLEHKTTADCVEFYYKNHKSELFETTRMILRSKKKKKGKLLSTKTYMKTNRRNKEADSISVDLLEAASVMETQRQPKEPFLRVCSRKTLVSMENQMSGVDLLAEVCTSLYSKAASDDLDEGAQDRSEQSTERATEKSPNKREQSTERAREKSLNKSRRGRNISHWTDDEKSLFVWAVSRYGKDFKKISKCVRTRSRNQCRAFFGKARKCLRLDLVLQERNSSAVGAATNGHNGVSGRGNNNAASRKEVAALTSVTGEVTLEPDYGVSDVNLSDQTDCKASHQEYEGFEEVPVCGNVVAEMNFNEQAPRLAADSSPCSVFSLSSDLRIQSPIDLDEEEKPSGVKNSRGISSPALSLEEDRHSSVAKINEGAGSERSNDMWDVSNSISQKNLLKDRSLDCRTCPRTTQSQHHHLPMIPRKCSEKEGSQSGGGDIKLFGQILTLPKKPNSSILKEDNNKTQHIKVTENSAFGKFDRDNHLGLENIPTSYGFWDGNRVSSLPPLLSKSTPAMAAALAPQQQQPFQEAAARTFCQGSSIGVPPIFPSREMIDSWSRDIAKIHRYFAVDVKQQARQQMGNEGGNVVQSDISDPVAALRMHYARVNPLWGHGVGVVKQEGNNPCSDRGSKG